MGAWGHGIFDNDTAADWAFTLEESSDLSAIVEAVNAVFEDEYVDSDIACEALVAIEAVARLKGQWGEKSAYSEPVDNWVEKTPIEPPKELIESCKKALKSISSHSSELYESWSESDDLESWLEEIKNLESRINA